jgi:hypothetical protein
MGRIFTFKYLPEHNALTGIINAEILDGETGKSIYETAMLDFGKQHSHDHFILDCRNVRDVSLTALGYLMKALGNARKTRGYMLLVLDDTLLQKQMLEHPEMFDHFAVFPTTEEAISFTKKE